ncbi:MAG: aldose 1-epimerase family protein [Hyphomicrobiales bacterium]|nr:aldose 1-epimerase family protein [Hyphomicrobiales bacterium]
MLELVNGPARLRIARRGAEPVAWSIGETPLLWASDAAVWPQVAPILFPVVGWTRNGEIRHRGVSYPMGVHGFAASQMFEPLETGSAFARFALRANDETRAQYPFEFRLEAVYRLERDALVWALEATNLGREPMPYALGVHPGFRRPLAGSTEPHVFAFDEPERAAVPVIAPGGLFSDAMRPIALESAERALSRMPLQGENDTGAARGRRLALTDDLLAQEALCFLGLQSAGATLDNGAGAQIRIELENYPHLALWARPPAPFLCIEAWTGHGDPVGFAGEVSEKPSMRLLAPGETGRHVARFAVKTPGGRAGALGAAARV